MQEKNYEDKKDEREIRIEIVGHIIKKIRKKYNNKAKELF